MILLLFTLLPLFIVITTFQNRHLLTLYSIGLSTFILSITALTIYLNQFTHSYIIFDSLHWIFILSDIVLLCYFLLVGLKHLDRRVYLLAFLQLLLYGYIEFFTEVSQPLQLTLDPVSSLMLLVINLVGGMIIYYAHFYMQYEQSTFKDKRFFLIALPLFVVVMNILVLCDNWLLFFLFFELTTLFSFLLIAFRKDAISVNNALNALAINQIGGVFILLAILYNQLNNYPLSFEHLSFGTLGLILFALAAFVKGASKPFESWLLGAMVAPTPVSAILHSATMVKIAPYIVLNIAVGLSLFQANLIALFGAFVFVVMVLQALNKTKFKEILAYSTIAMLAFMISLAVYGKGTVEIVLYLIFFHAVTKGILFMMAGILEKKHHIYTIDDFDSLLHKDKNVAIMILISFGAMCLPPFGLFVSKLMGFVYLAQQLQTNLFTLIILLLLVIGSALLVLLYFKIASIMLQSNESSTQTSWLDPFMLPNTFLLIVLVISSVIVVSNQNDWLLYFNLLFALIIVIYLISRKKLSHIKRIDPYNCAETDEVHLGLFSYQLNDYDKVIQYSSYALLVIMVLGSLWKV